MQIYPFSKYSGCGNDFIFIDNRENSFDYTNKGLIKAICHRQKGVGADGLVLVERSTKADSFMRIINSDGSEAAMCGNALRCIHPFCLNQLKIAADTIESAQGIHLLSFSPEGVAATLQLVSAHPFQSKIPCDYYGIKEIDFIDTGVPHALFFVEDSKRVDLALLGPKIRNDRLFAPQGANVNAVQVVGDSTLLLRTYERGVEGETFACGTGATAAALAAHRRGYSSSPTTVKFASGDFLKISFCYSDGLYSNIIMSGAAKHLFDGVFSSEAFGADR